MLAALAVTPSASAARVKCICSATATNTRRLPSGSLRNASRGVLERRCVTPPEVVFVLASQHLS
jgi:hypothetical protein